MPRKRKATPEPAHDDQDAVNEADRQCLETMMETPAVRNRIMRDLRALMDFVADADGLAKKLLGPSMTDEDVVKCEIVDGPWAQELSEASAEWSRCFRFFLDRCADTTANGDQKEKRARDREAACVEFFRMSKAVLDQCASNAYVTHARGDRNEPYDEPLLLKVPASDFSLSRTPHYHMTLRLLDGVWRDVPLLPPDVPEALMRQRWGASPVVFRDGKWWAYLTPKRLYIGKENLLDILLKLMGGVNREIVDPKKLSLRAKANHALSVPVKTPASRVSRKQAEKWAHADYVIDQGDPTTIAHLQELVWNFTSVTQSFVDIIRAYPGATPEDRAEWRRIAKSDKPGIILKRHFYREAEYCAWLETTGRYCRDLPHGDRVPVSMSVLADAVTIDVSRGTMVVPTIQGDLILHLNLDGHEPCDPTKIRITMPPTSAQPTVRLIWKI